LLLIFSGREKAHPDPSRVAAIQQVLISSLKPVRPLPSNGRLTVMALLAAILLMLVCTVPFGYFGIRALSVGKMLVYCGVVLFAGIMLALAMVQDMTPAARRTFPRPLLIVGIFVVLIGIVLLLFADSSSTPGPGIPCLAIGLFGAAIAGVAACLLLRKGVLTTPVQTCCVTGTLAGLVGFGSLALHCPVLRASHILPWHLGAMAISGCAGAAIGVILELLPRSRETPASVTR
jgi:hypothetical protein